MIACKLINSEWIDFHKALDHAGHRIWPSTSPGEFIARNSANGFSALFRPEGIVELCPMQCNPGKQSFARAEWVTRRVPKTIMPYCVRRSYRSRASARSIAISCIATEEPFGLSSGTSTVQTVWSKGTRFRRLRANGLVRSTRQEETKAHRSTLN